ncbi:hypothetical protein [Guptibacillus spartinae]|uniref:hypothetical protein n=1 Tax=Guptibacillus spartinae TaxID=3025679 RepID=UPI002360B06F|nr:hypothetical protein [Pseudalkalibacillus spartinae]
MLKQLVQENGSIEIPAKGNSMFPIIQEDDPCLFTECQPSLLNKGDIALFYTSSGQLVGHRLIRTAWQNGERYYTFKGDTNLGVDIPVVESAVIGKLVHVKKKKFLLDVDHFPAVVWRWVILSFPFLSGVLRQYLNKKSK